MINELQKVKKYLPTRYIKMLSEEFNCTGKTVREALNGETSRLDIITRANELANENKKNREENISKSNIPRLYTKSEAAKILRVSERTIENLIRTGQLGSVKIGRKRLFAEKHLNKLIANGEIID